MGQDAEANDVEIQLSDPKASGGAALLRPENTVQHDDDQGCGWFKEESRNVPYRMQQVLISWLFIVASVAILLEMVALQTWLANYKPAFAEVEPSFAKLCNWFGVLSSYSWVVGFILLAHWLHQVGAKSMGLLTCYMKLLASFLFCIEPMTGVANISANGFGCWWSNLEGVCFFQMGTLLSCWDFYLNTPLGASKDQGWLYHGNLPITSTWVYQAGTWCLFFAILLTLPVKCREELVPPDLADCKVWYLLLPMDSLCVIILQYSGASLLLLGSVIYAIWCNGFGNFSN